MASTASGTGTRVASPSADVAARSVSTGRPARQERVIDGAPAACTPTTRVDGDACRSHAPIPTMSAPFPTGT